MQAFSDPMGILIALLVVCIIIAGVGWMLALQSDRFNGDPGNRDKAERPSLLVAVDGSSISARAVELACRLSQGGQSRIVLANVMEVPLRFKLDAPLPEAEVQAQAALDTAAQTVKDRRLKCETRIVRDRTTTGGLVDLARELRASMVVVGFDGALQNGGRDVEVVSELFRFSPCEVVVAREPSRSQLKGLKMGRLIQSPLRA